MTTGTLATGSTASSARESGFSLVELLVVVAILTMIAAVFPLALDRLLPQRRITAAAEALFVHLRQAQSAAISRGKAVRIVAGLDHYTLEYPVGQSTRVDLTADLSLVLTREPQQQPVADIVFFSDGSSTGGSFTLSDGTRQASVTTSRLTGRITRDR